MPHLFVDNLTVIDCSILDPQRGLIGASWIVDIELFGQLDNQSMIFDFGHVKKRIKHIIDSEVDHKLVIPKQYSGLSLTQESDSTSLYFTDKSNHILEHISPPEALCLIDTETINHDNVIEYLSTLIKKELPSNVEGLKLTFREEDDYAFYYCYSHGLKKHDGNCQRIAHGHRSRIEVWENDKRSRTWEQYWADELTDIYIGSQSDISHKSPTRSRFSYDAPQGHFEIELDNEKIHTMDSDSTVECIAEHIAEKIKQLHPTSAVKVKAFEGVKKGAIATR
jgi:6-pyruvoyl-tetrahydropterin synthase